MYCDDRCAEVYLPFWASCSDWLTQSVETRPNGGVETHGFDGARMDTFCNETETEDVTSSPGTTRQGLVYEVGRGCDWADIEPPALHCCEGEWAGIQTKFDQHYTTHEGVSRSPSPTLFGVTFALKLPHRHQLPFFCETTCFRELWPVWARCKNIM